MGDVRKPSEDAEDVEDAVAAIEIAVKLIGDSEVVMRRYPATTKDHDGIRAVVEPTFRNAIDFLDRHKAHMALIKATLAMVMGK